MAANSEGLEELEDTAPISARNEGFRDFESQYGGEEDISEPDSRETSEKEKEIHPLTELRRCKAWLRLQKIDHEAQLITYRQQQTEDLQLSSGDDAIASDHSERVSKLQDQLFSVSSKNSFQKIMLERLLSGDLLIQRLFPDTITDVPNQGQWDKVNDYSEIVGKNDDLCTRILEEHQALVETQKELDLVKLRNFDIKKTNRELMVKLQELKKKRETPSNSTTENDALKRAKEKLKDSTAKVNVVGNIFQGLIVGSGINWAADDNMRQLVLSLGEIRQSR